MASHAPRDIPQEKHVQFRSPLHSYEPRRVEVNALRGGGPSGTVTVFPEWAAAIVSVLLIGVFVVWVLGLVRMGRCGGRQSWLWWATIFIPIFVPGIGQLWALVVGILALVILRNGGKLLTMQCPKK